MFPFSGLTCLSSQVDSAQISPHRNAPARGFPGRAAFGCALVARWAWSHHTNSIPKLEAALPVRGPFESLTHAVYSARWEKSGGTWARTNVSTGTGTNTPTRATSAQYSSGPGTPGLTTPAAYSGYSRGSTPTLQAPSPSLGLTPGMFSLNSPPPGNNHAEGTENANSGTSALVPISALPIMYPSATLSSKDGEFLSVYGRDIFTDGGWIQRTWTLPKPVWRAWRMRTMMRF